jgi:hypothetical protein
MQASIKRRLTGIAPIILNNVRMANPLDDFAKALKRITGKRNKTDADFEEMRKIEWYGSLYLKDGRVCVPGVMLDACLVAAAKKVKKGPQAKAGLFSVDDFIIEYDGPSDIDELFASKISTFTIQCRPQGKSTVMRTRVRFDQWAIDAEIAYNTELLNESRSAPFRSVACRSVTFCLVPIHHIRSPTKSWRFVAYRFVSCCHVPYCGVKYRKVPLSHVPFFVGGQT